MNPLVLTLFLAGIGQFGPDRPGCNCRDCAPGDGYHALDECPGDGCPQHRYAPQHRLLEPRGGGMLPPYSGNLLSREYVPEQSNRFRERADFPADRSYAPRSGGSRWNRRNPDSDEREQSRPVFRSASQAGSRQRLCPVSGEELGSMGPPIAVRVNGRTIWVGSRDCVAAVQENPDEYLDIVERQLSDSAAPDYGAQQFSRPAARMPGMRWDGQRVCPVSGEELGSRGEPVPITVQGQRIWVCCRACAAVVYQRPEQFFGGFDVGIGGARDESGRFNSYDER